jgi:hypothetical protein
VGPGLIPCAVVGTEDASTWLASSKGGNEGGSAPAPQTPDASSVGARGNSPVLPSPPLEEEKYVYAKRHAWVLTLCSLLSFPPLVYSEFVAAWRRIHNLFAQAGASNVVWVWNPNDIFPVPQIGAHFHRAQFGVAVWGGCLLLGMVQAGHLYDSWPNGRPIVAELSRYLAPHAH